MNIKITNEQHNRLMAEADIIAEFTFGSHLFGINNAMSDKDILRLYEPTSVFDSMDYESVSHLPNIHSFQYDDSENNQQVIWMTIEQFHNGIAKGDGIINLDCYIFIMKPDIKELYTYNIIKAYLGVAKRDIKQSKNRKKVFHAQKSIYIADSIMRKRLPEAEMIKEIWENPCTPELIIETEKNLREELNRRLNSGEIHHYYVPNMDDDLLSLMVNANNIREFKYD